MKPWVVITFWVLAGLCLALWPLLLQSCSSHRGLAKSVASGSLEGCVDWAKSHGDPELEQLCSAGRPLTEVLDLFAARQTGKDAGHD